jgi:GntR family transcriptional regulator
MAATPLYAHVRQVIIDRIVSGELGPGAMLPSEMALAAELGVSQGTVRKALIDLEQSGVIRRRQGQGTFVATTTPERALFHFFRLRRADGSQVVPELVSEDISPRDATDEEQATFGQSGPVYQIDRVRRIDGARLTRELCVLPQSLFPGLTERAPLPNTLYALFQRAYGVAVVRANERLRAVAATSGDAAVLGVPAGQPLLEVRREAIDITDRIVEVRASRLITDDLHYDVRLS